MATERCKQCAGVGWTAEHDKMENHNPEDGSCLTCPIQAQCQECRGTGEIDVCPEGICDGSGYIEEEIAVDDSRTRRCACNSKADIEADMDDDS